METGSGPDPGSRCPVSTHHHLKESIVMLKARKGFTLIELLIVIVIIGILAAIAIPKFGKTRERAYFNAMQSDLRNLQAQQEVFYANPANNYTYTQTIGAGGVDIQPSAGVTITIVAAGQTGWAATAAHQALTAAQTCALFTDSAAPVAPATTAGVLACTGM
jgi:type IV pilus assembly protein PilA